MIPYKTAVENSLEYFGGNELAAKTFVGKYALRDRTGELLESTPDDMHRRLAKEFARIEAKYPNSITEDEIFSYFRNFQKIIPQGSPMAGIGNTAQLVSLSNCYVIDSPYDSISGIAYTDNQQANLMKRRAGVGFDISSIRPSGAFVANAAGTSTGIASFMEKYSETTRGIGQGGRRGALMLSISCMHPEIETFITIKQNLEKVTGANISIRFTDEFMKAVKDDSEVTLRWPVEGPEIKISKTVKAKDIWNKFVYSAWFSAEPGALFWDTAIKRTPSDCYAERGYRSISTNPCFAGDTLIAVADGRNAVSIKQLAEEGRDVPVYSLDKETGITSIKTARNPRVTGYNKKLVRVELDNGSYFDVTPDHKCILRDGTIVLAKDLKAGDSLPRFKKESASVETYKEISWKTSKDLKNIFRSMLSQGYKAEIVGNEVRVQKTCETCKSHFHISHLSRETAFCSIACSAAYVNSSKEKAKKKFLTKAGEAYNHKVVSVTDLNGEHTVYNLTVDDNHTVAIVSEQSDKDSRFVWYDGIHVAQCGEIILSGGDSCRLLLVNAMGFVTDPFKKEARFDWDAFSKATVVAQRLMDDLVDLELEAIEKIISKITQDPEPEHIKRAELDLWAKIQSACKNGRRTGLGLTAVGDMLAALGMVYGGEDSIRFTEHLYRTLAINSYKSSVEMAKERGAFPVFSFDLESDNEFLNQIWAADKNLHEEYLKYGRRNIANTTTPPAGTTSILACLDSERKLFGTTSGIEPAYLLSYKRRKKINPNDKEARVDFVDDLGDKWQEFPVYHPGFKFWMDVTGNNDSDIERSPYYQATSNDVNWMNSVDIQAAAQKWICHSISKTCNLPANATQELVSDVYLRAWETGCKGFTIYRDGCRSGVLVSADESSKKKKEGSFDETNAPKRPKELSCDIYHCTVQGEKWSLFVGLLDGKPYEIMGGLAKYVKIPKRVTKGKLIKHNGEINPARYDLHYDFEDGLENEAIVQDVGNVFANPTHSGFTRMVSLSLRHGAPVQFVAEQLMKGSDKESDLFSITKAVNRVLKNYIKDGTKANVRKCPECGGSHLAYKDGCVQCMDCGNSKCS